MGPPSPGHRSNVRASSLTRAISGTRFSMNITPAARSNTLTDLNSDITSKSKEETPENLERDLTIESLDPVAMVQLSYEPIVNTDAESISELFNVLYNTIQSKYNEFRHRGILGDTALSWLTEA